MTEILSKQSSAVLSAKEESFLNWNEVLQKFSQTFGKDVYESKEWLNEMVDKVGQLIDRNRTVVRNLKSTELSVMK